MILPVMPTSTIALPTPQFIDLRPETLLPIAQPQFPDRTKQSLEAVAQDAVEAAQAVVEAQAVQVAAQQAQASYTPPANVPAGSHADMMAAAGISPADYQYVEYIVAHESGWRFNAQEPHSGAYGMCQSLPASKMISAGADFMTNPITQLRWCTGYAQARYGGWAGAYSFWLSNHWW